MAKKSVEARNKKRKIKVERYAQKRAELKHVIKKGASFEERYAAAVALQKLPRDASPSRVRNRCRLTGRAHGYYRKFGLARNMLRLYAMRGAIPGLVKASW